MTITNYKEYWKIVRKNSREKTTRKLGFGIRILAVVVAAISTTSVSLILGGNILKVIIDAVLTILINIIIWLIIFGAFYAYYKDQEPVVLYNNQEKIVSTLNSQLLLNKARINISGYHYPNYLQAIKVGISISNEDQYDIFPRVKILGNLEQIEFFDDGSRVSGTLRLDNSNRIIGKDINFQVGHNDTDQLFFVEVENNENVSFLLKTHLLLKSFYSVRSRTYNLNRVRWDFRFQIFGDINGEQFNNGVYSTYIEAYMRGDEVFVQIGEPEKLSEIF